MQDLGTLGGTISGATGINASGQITGYSTTAGDTTEKAFVYSGGTMQALGTLGGSITLPDGINAYGQVVGRSNLAGSPAVTHAFSYHSNGTMQDYGGRSGVRIVMHTASMPVGRSRATHPSI